MMKNNILFLLFIAVLFGGCAKERQRDCAERIPVEVAVVPAGGSWGEVDTRAPMDGWHNTPTHMAYCELQNGDPFSSFDRALNAMVVGIYTTFTPLLFYPANGDDICLRGFFPRDGISNLTPPFQTITANRIKYTITGQEDIMISNMVRGSMTNTLADQGSTLAYNHLLTRLSFRLKGEDGFPLTLKVTQIRVSGLRVKAELDLTKNYDEAGCLTFTDTPTTILKAYDNPAGFALQSSWSIDMANIMFEPGAAFGLEVEMSDGTVIPITSVIENNGSNDILLGNTVRGEHYGIDLNFKVNSTQVEVNALWDYVTVKDTPQEWW